MRTRTRRARPRAPVEMDAKELAWTGVPPERWPGLLAAALLTEVARGKRLDIALPGEQAQAVAAGMVALMRKGRATGTVQVGPHRLGWNRLTARLGPKTRTAPAIERRPSG